jgi:DNA-directed RNA polymerase subunit H (RpoH/RPB5)
MSPVTKKVKIKKMDYPEINNEDPYIGGLSSTSL